MMITPWSVGENPPMTQATAQVLPFIPKPPSFGDMLVTEGFNRDIDFVGLG